MTETKPPSERHLIAIELAAAFCEAGYCNPFGGDVSLWRSAKRPCYGFLISYPRLMDGDVRVFSPSFIAVTMKGPLVRGDFSAVYGSRERVLEVMRSLRTGEFDRVPPREAS